LRSSPTTTRNEWLVRVEVGARRETYLELVSDETAEQSGDDHHEIKEDDKSSAGHVGTSEVHQVEEEQRGGQGPEMGNTDRLDFGTSGGQEVVCRSIPVDVTTQ